MNIGIIGLGTQGKIRYDSIMEINDPDYRITMVNDVYKPDWVSNNIVYTEDYNKIVENDDIDIVFVCTPNNLTEPIVVRSLNNGKHVFSEKPPGRNLEELKSMQSAEKANPGLKLMFGFNHRHHDSLIQAKKKIESGELGKILWMRGRYGKGVKEDFKNNWRSKKDIAGGGIFLDQGIHMLDLFLMMVDNFDEVKAYVSKLFWKSDIEDNVFAIFRNKKGQVASLHSTMTQWRHLFSLEIFMEKGHIVINGLLTTSGSYGKEQMSIAKNTQKNPAVGWEMEERYTYNINTSWVNEIKMFFDTIKNDTDVPVGNSNDAYKLMRLVDMVYKEGEK